MLDSIFSSIVLVLTWIKNVLYFMFIKIYNKYFNKMKIISFKDYSRNNSDGSEIVYTVKYNNKLYDIGVISDGGRMFYMSTLIELFELCIPYSYISMAVTTPNEENKSHLKEQLDRLRVMHIHNGRVCEDVYLRWLGLPYDDIVQIFNNDNGTNFRSDHNELINL